MVEFLVGIDCYLFLLFNRTLANPLFDAFFPYITDKRNWYAPIVIAVTVYLIAARDRKKASIVIGLAILTVALSDPLCIRVLKPLFQRLRPCHPSYFQDGKHLFLTGGRFLLGTKFSLSLPSGHAMNSFAQAMHLTLWYPRKKAWFLSIATLVALSRVYVGVHYPSDIFLGALLGLVLGASVFYAYRRINTATMARLGRV